MRVTKGPRANLLIPYPVWFVSRTSSRLEGEGDEKGSRHGEGEGWGGRSGDRERVEGGGEENRGRGKKEGRDTAWREIA